MTTENQLLRPKLENIISGHNINHDDADWLRAALTHPAQPVEGGGAAPAGYVSSVQSNSPLMCGLSDWERKGLIPLYTAPPASQERDREQFMAGYAAAEADAAVCQVPPPGWHCTRKAGHEGPCAAVQNDDAAFVQRGMDRLRETSQERPGVVRAKARMQEWSPAKRTSMQLQGEPTSQEQAQQSSERQAWANETGLRQIECPSCGDLAVAYDPQQPSGGEVVAWRDYVEQRLHSWHHSGMNQDGDRVALADYLNDEAISDLIDYVCSEYEDPLATPKPEPMTWQPIETAPKDGTLFLCWVSAVRYGETDEGQQYQQDASQVDFCRWRNCDESPNGGYFDACCGQIADVQHVTLWMPLPPAPITKGEA